MKLSIVVPCHHNELTLSRAVDSFLSDPQSKEAELIVVLDGLDEDPCKAILDGYAANPNVRCLYPHAQNGPLKARKLGLAEARGEYIGFLDADDYLAKGALSRLLELLSEQDPDILNYSFFISTPKKDSKNFFVHPAGRLLPSKAFAALQNDAYIRGFLWSKVYRKAIIEEGFAYALQRGTDPFEDTLVNAIAFAQAKTFYYVPEPLYHYVKNEGGTAVSLPRTNRAEYHLAAFASIQLYLEKMADKPLLDAFFRSKFRSYLSLLYDLSCDKKFGLSNIERKTRQKEFHAIYEAKKPLDLDGTSYLSHIDPRLMK